jgi:hypothetical protein
MPKNPHLNRILNVLPSRNTENDWGFGDALAAGVAKKAVIPASNPIWPTQRAAATPYRSWATHRIGSSCAIAGARRRGAILASVTPAQRTRRPLSRKHMG